MPHFRSDWKVSENRDRVVIVHMYELEPPNWNLGQASSFWSFLEVTFFLTRHFFLHTSTIEPTTYYTCSSSSFERNCLLGLGEGHFGGMRVSHTAPLISPDGR